MLMRDLFVVANLVEWRNLSENWDLWQMTKVRISAENVFVISFVGHISFQAQNSPFPQIFSIIVR